MPHVEKGMLGKRRKRLLENEIDGHRQKWIGYVHEVASETISERIMNQMDAEMEESSEEGVSK
jgi:hypothetical protein